MSKITYKQFGIFIFLLFLIFGCLQNIWATDYNSSPPYQVDSTAYRQHEIYDSSSQKGFFLSHFEIFIKNPVELNSLSVDSLSFDRFSLFKSISSVWQDISFGWTDSFDSAEKLAINISDISFDDENTSENRTDVSKNDSNNNIDNAITEQTSESSSKLSNQDQALQESNSSIAKDELTVSDDKREISETISESKLPSELTLSESTSKANKILSYEEKILAESENLEKQERRSAAPQKWIPNFRVLAGIPPTILDLSDSIAKFDLEGAFGTPGALKPELLSVSVVSPSPSDTSVVDLEVQGTNLILNWADHGNKQTEVIVRIEYPDCLPVFLSFNAEVWQPNYLWMIAIVIGGLGLFLIGMRNMSEGVQMMAGSSLRRLIAFFTENRFLAVGIGVLTTMLIQSSSVTTVMVVGFINSQIMTLSQGIGVIMGANIGTTVTGWILALKIEDFGLPLVGLSAFFYLFSSNVRVRYVSMSLMGLGLIFFGLKTMQSGFFILKDLPSFSHWMTYLDARTFFGVIKCACLGCLMTLVLQSSSATIGITISLATIGVIDFNTAAAFVLGENVGTTITALLASIGTTTAAKRAAYFHVIFNIVGVCWVLTIFLPVVLPLVTSLANVQDERNIAAGIALTHTLFNVSNTLLFLPFTRVFASLLTRFVKDSQEPKDAKLMLTSLGIRNMETPVIAIERSRVEILRMMNGCIQLNDWIEKIIKEKDYENKDLIEQAFKQEDILDHMQDEVITFLAEMMSKNLSVDIAETAREQLRMADELETVSDYFISILKSNLKLHETGLNLPEIENESFTELDNTVRDHLMMIRKSYTERDDGTEVLQDIYQRRKGFTFRVKQTRDRFLKQMSEEKIDPQVVVAFNSQLNFYRRLREHAQNIAEAMTNVR